MGLQALHLMCGGGWASSAKASTAAAALRARVAELARKADLAQTLLGNLVPVSMRDLATTRRVQRSVPCTVTPCIGKKKSDHDRPRLPGANMESATEDLTVTVGKLFLPAQTHRQLQGQQPDIGFHINITFCMALP